MNKSLTLKTIKEADCDMIEKLAYFVRKFKNFSRKSKKALEKFKCKSNTSSKDKREKSNVGDAWKRPVRCYECHGFGHVKSECPSYKETLGRAMNATPAVEESFFDNQSENSILMRDGLIWHSHLWSIVSHVRKWRNITVHRKSQKMSMI